MYQRLIQSRKSALEIQILDQKKTCWIHSLMEWGLEVRFKIVFGQGHPTIVFCKVLFEEALIIQKFL